jgi:hypothetical protein
LEFFLHVPLIDHVPYPLYPALSTPSNPSSEPLYSQLLLPYELEYAPYEPPAKGVGGPAAPDDIYVSVIGGQPSFPIAVFNYTVHLEYKSSLLHTYAMLFSRTL